MNCGGWAPPTSRNWNITSPIVQNKCQRHKSENSTSHQVPLMSVWPGMNNMVAPCLRSQLRVCIVASVWSTTTVDTPDPRIQNIGFLSFLCGAGMISRCDVAGRRKVFPDFRKALVHDTLTIRPGAQPHPCLTSNPIPREYWSHRSPHVSLRHHHHHHNISRSR
jgi:hypothetical protein